MEYITYTEKGDPIFMSKARVPFNSDLLVLLDICTAW